MDILVTKRLTLRPPLEVDIDGITRGLTNPNVAKMLGSVPQSYCADDARIWLDKVSGELCVYTIHRQRLVGCVGVHQHREHLELGYWLVQSAWGNGFATEAARAVLARAFRQFDADEIISGAAIENAASLRVQSKLGFETVGTTTRKFKSRGQDVEAVVTRLTRNGFETRFGSLETNRAA